MNRPANVVHVEQVEPKQQGHGDSYGWNRRSLAAAAGGRKLGCSLYELAPGKRSFPYHYHCANEEAIFVLEGEGTLRLPSGETSIGAGDYVALAPGETSAHQVINSSNGTLRYLCISTLIGPEITVYPDKQNIGFFAAVASGGAREQGPIQGFVRLDSRVDYWDRED